MYVKKNIYMIYILYEKRAVAESRTGDVHEGNETEAGHAGETVSGSGTERERDKTDR